MFLRNYDKELQTQFTFLKILKSLKSREAGVFLNKPTGLPRWGAKSPTPVGGMINSFRHGGSPR